MDSELLERQLRQAWDELTSNPVLPEAAFLAKLPPGRFAVFAALEEAREIVSGWRASDALMTKASRYVNSSWSLRDLLAHIASWARELRSQVVTAAAGADFDYTIPFALTLIGPSQWNQKELEKRKEYTISDALKEFENETAALQDLILELPDEVLHRPWNFPMSPGGDPNGRFPGTIAMMAFLQTRHYAYHLRQIQTRML